MFFQDYLYDMMIDNEETWYVYAEGKAHLIKQVVSN